MARKEKKIVHWPAWRYSPDTGEGRIFDHPKDVPEDWTDNPNPVLFTPTEARVLKGAELIAALKAKGIKINPQWPYAYMEQLNDSTPPR